MSFTFIGSFYNIKGGAQKSTLTALMATALHYRLPKTYKVAVIDADPQKTISRKRAHDLEDLEQDDKKRETYEALSSENQAKNGKDGIYPIYAISARYVTEIKKKIVELVKSGYNFILIDFPGSITDVGVQDILQILNFIFVPVDWDPNSRDTSYACLSLLRKMQEDENLNAEDISVLFTKYPPASKKKGRAVFEEIRNELTEQGFHIYDSYFAESEHFKNEDDLLYSTLFPFPSLKKYEAVNPNGLFKEIFARVVQVVKEKREQAGKESRAASEERNK